MTDQVFPVNRLHLLGKMAPTQDAQVTEAAEVDDKTLMLKEALKCVNGNLDFDKLAEKLGVANAAAMYG